MRKSNQEVKDKKIIERVLENAFICRLGMVDEGLPYIVPMNYGYKDNCLYMHAAVEGKKLELLKKNNKVCFEIEEKAQLVKNDKACNWATIYRSIIGYGTVVLLNVQDERKYALNIIMKHHGADSDFDFTDKQVQNVAILKLEIESLTCKKSSNWDKQHEESELVFESDRIKFGEVEWEHLEKIHEIHSHPEVDEFNTLGIPKDLNETKAIVKSCIDARYVVPRVAYHWMLLHKDTNEIIGMAGFFLSNDKFKLGEIYYKLIPEYWGRGLGTEIAKRLIQIGFEQFKLHKVEAGVAVGNHASVKVLEKVGMVREGLRRKILPIRGEWVDNYHYAIVENSDT